MREWLEQDVKLALRAVRRNPGFSLLVIAVLALGMGANTALFTAIDRVLLRPLPFPESARLVEIHETAGRSVQWNPVSYPNFLDWRKRSHSFESISYAAIFPRNLRRPGAPAEKLKAAYVSGDFFKTYRVAAAAGRLFNDTEDRREAAPVAVLTRGAWLTRFGSDPAILGKPVTLDSQTFTVVGILPEFPYRREADVYVPVSHGAAIFMLDRRENHNNSSVTARLHPNIPVEQARAELVQIAASLEAEYPGSNKGLSVNVQPLQDVVSGGSRNRLLVLGGAVFSLLLLACVNVANLMLVRASARAKEISVRAALGANPVRVARQLLTESLVLGLAGGVAGVLVARLGVVLLTRLVPGSLAAGLTQPDWRVFLFTALLAVSASLLFGSAPAWHAARLDVQDTLRKSGRGNAVGGSGRLRGALVVAQVTLAVVLVTGAGLFLRSLQKLLGEDPGFRTGGLIAMSVDFPGAETQMGKVPGRYARIAEAVRAVPGVQTAALVNSLPLTGDNSSANIQPEGYQPPTVGQWPAADYRAVSPEYFATMGLPLLRGRLFDRRDGEIPPLAMKDILPWFRSTRFVCVANQAMADRFWPGQDPTGKRFRFGPPAFQGPWVEVIGVVGNTRQKGLDRAPEPMYYMSALLYPWPFQTLLVRTASPPPALLKSMRQAILQADADAVIAEPRTFDDVVAEATSGQRANLRLMAIFAAFAVILAATGVYGVVSFVAGARSQEFGIRMALGAVPEDVLGLVLRQGAALVVVGLSIGLLACLALGRTVEKMLYGIAATDPVTYATAAAVLLLAGIAASAVPAHRATRVDPVTTLRAE